MTPRFAYFDTSLLVPLYIRSEASPLAERALAALTEGGSLPLLLSELTGVEFVSTVAKHVRMRQIDRARAREAVAAFERHCRHDFLVLPVESSDYAAAREWIGRAGASLKTLDGLHMAVAVANKCVLATADRQLAAAAEEFGVEHCFVSYREG